MRARMNDRHGIGVDWLGYDRLAVALAHIARVTRTPGSMVPVSAEAWIPSAWVEVNNSARQIVIHRLVVFRGRGRDWLRLGHLRLCWLGLRGLWSPTEPTCGRLQCNPTAEVPRRHIGYCTGEIISKG